MCFVITFYYNRYYFIILVALEECSEVVEIPSSCDFLLHQLCVRLKMRASYRRTYYLYCKIYSTLGRRSGARKS